MPKRPLNPTEAFDLRQSLHVATLDALMASRRWQPGDLVFQGGTSLHLAHGSPRFSEDLGFLVRSSLRLGDIGEKVLARLEGTHWLPADTQIAVTGPKEGRNPLSLIVSLGGANVIGAVRVKVEMWQTDERALAATRAVVCPVKLARGPAAGIQAFVPTAELQEIYADKVFALAARPFLKPRDVFDLHWLVAHHGLKECDAQHFRTRLATYPNESPQAWLDKACARIAQLADSHTAIAQDLSRWLPSSWPINDAHAHTMVANASYCLEQAMPIMQALANDDGAMHDAENVIDQPKP